ncbi:C-GCAxxG-C-C family protein [Maridesulfovibrio salexigens]|uniref:C_GCAxxG_C_C family protein n=1 Tax=Maridesulfovibrio salexigens (strain ATCC 14822 / DSM 2638 / NCIMB 8403 / VKM B-1763) TaxID=526222 RepID=C6BSK2_MARSD|nr:C-GCAxxG-C-C family protein [Maridesulfovibrio salexigens]ACS81458.1 C_GCAxxG_C_C family protein [Maridesulfovibrio salexigens DSM 2638]
MEPRDQAVTALLNGSSCAQAVLEALGNKYGLGADVAKKITAGLGGGLASGLTCGAVSGGCLALGLALGSDNPADTYSRERTYYAVQELLARFAKINHSHQCSEILSLNDQEIKTPEGKKRLRESKLCLKLVTDTIDCIEDILNEEL